MVYVWGIVEDCLHLLEGTKREQSERNARGLHSIRPRQELSATRGISWTFALTLFKRVRGTLFTVAEVRTRSSVAFKRPTVGAITVRSSKTKARFKAAGPPAARARRWSPLGDRNHVCVQIKLELRKIQSIRSAGRQIPQYCTWGTWQAVELYNDDHQHAAHGKYKSIANSLLIVVHPSKLRTHDKFFESFVYFRFVQYETYELKPLRLRGDSQAKTARACFRCFPLLIVCLHTSGSGSRCFITPPSR